MLNALSLMFIVIINCRLIIFITPKVLCFIIMCEQKGGIYFIVSIWALYK